MSADAESAPGSGWSRLWAVAPLVLLLAIVLAFTTYGESITDLLGRNPPPVDAFDVRRVEFHPGEIRIKVTNPQPEDLTIASVTVDDAIVPYSLDGPRVLSRLRSSTIVVPFEWIADDPITVGITSSTGIETVEEIPAAFQTPQASPRGMIARGGRLLSERLAGCLHERKLDIRQRTAQLLHLRW